MKETPRGSGGAVSWRARGPGACSDPRKTELLLEHAREGNVAAREELRWLYRPKLVRIIRARTPGSWVGPHRPRPLADSVLERGLRGLDRFEYAGTASLWCYLREVTRDLLLGLYRGKFPGQALPSPSLFASRPIPVGTATPGNALARELERDAFERFLVFAAGWHGRRAVLLRLDLGLELEEIAAVCGHRTAHAARRAIEYALLSTLTAMTRQTASRVQREPLTSLITSAIDQGNPSSIEVLLSHPRLQDTRRGWVEESGWLSIPGILSHHLANLVRGPEPC